MAGFAIPLSLPYATKRFLQKHIIDRGWGCGGAFIECFGWAAGVFAFGVFAFGALTFELFVFGAFDAWGTFDVFAAFDAFDG